MRSGSKKLRQKSFTRHPLGKQVGSIFNTAFYRLVQFLEQSIQLYFMKSYIFLQFSFQNH